MTSATRSSNLMRDKPASDARDRIDAIRGELSKLRKAGERTNAIVEQMQRLHDELCSISEGDQCS